DLSSRGIEDWDFWLRILEAGYRATVVPEILFEYRIRPGSMSEHIYRIEDWTAAVTELVHRHESFYRAHFRKLIVELHTRWASHRQWISNREEAIRWWQLQAKRQAGVASDTTALAEQRRSWIAELEQSKEWLESERAELERFAKEQADLIDEQSRWIAELENAKQWFEQQLQQLTGNGGPSRSKDLDGSAA